jgi:sugar O-acyltransferase (sialic acid O-acetyltransferase NeuD family)
MIKIQPGYSQMSMKKNIAIIGAGGMAREVAWLIENINRQTPTWNIVGFIEDKRRADIQTELLNGYKVFSEQAWLDTYKEEISVICGIGDGLIRKNIYKKYSLKPNIEIATLVDPSVRIDSSISIGQGSVICSNSIITVNSQIGSGVLINVNTLIGHDSTIGNYCTLAPFVKVSGGASLGELCSVGSGAFIIEGTSVIANSIIGPLAAVYKNIDVSGTYAGNPTRRVR